jgi:hypothetical protein
MAIGFAWISLDSLVRIESFQWVARDFPGRIFLGPFPGVRSAGNGSRRSGPCGCAELLHEASLAKFPIFFNQLSSDRKWRSDNLARQSAQCRDEIRTMSQRSASQSSMSFPTAAKRPIGNPEVGRTCNLDSRSDLRSAGNDKNAKPSTGLRAYPHPSPLPEGARDRQRPSFPGRNPHDLDRVADYAGGLFAFRASWHLS